MNQNRKKIRVLFLFLLSILIFLMNPVGNADLMDEYNTKPLTTLPIELHESPSVAVYGEIVHVVWNTWPNEYASYVYYKKSNDNGKTWSNITKLSGNSTKAIYPKIAVYDLIVHIVWKDYRDGNPEIYYANSVDNGDTWSLPQRLTFNSTQKNDIYDVNIAVDNNYLYLVWKGYTTGSSEIYFKKSFDTGETWSVYQQLTQDYYPSYYPTLAVDGSNVYIVYEDRGTQYDLCYLKSENRGDSWSEKQYLTNTVVASERPDLAVSENILYLVWKEENSGNSDIFIQKSKDNGETWTAKHKLTSNLNTSINPKIYAYKEFVIVVWHELQDESFSLIYKTSFDSGKTWNETKQLTLDMDCYNAEISGEELNVHMVWQVYNEAAWADIWHMGNYSFGPLLIPSNNDTLPVETPGFEFILISIAVFFLILFVRLNREYNKKKK